MTDIPDDIRATAEDLAAGLVGYPHPRDATADIAEALMAERERCAKIAESMDTDGRSNWGAFVARAIRSDKAR
jgi:hypothetical protein